jgi:hypothetical protein
MLMLISEELHDQPLYYEPDQLMRVIKCSMPKMAIFRSALLNAGFHCSGSHCNPKALKTNAPVQFIWDVCRAWVRKKSQMGNLQRGPNKYQSFLHLIWLKFLLTVMNFTTFKAKKSNINIAKLNLDSAGQCILGKEQM